MAVNLCIPQRRVFHGLLHGLGVVAPFLQVLSQVSGACWSVLILRVHVGGVRGVNADHPSGSVRPVSVRKII